MKIKTYKLLKQKKNHNKMMAWCTQDHMLGGGEKKSTLWLDLLLSLGTKKSFLTSLSEEP